MCQHLRSLFVEYANLNHADASAVFCHGRSVIQAILNGPEEISSNREDTEQAVVSVIYRKAIGGNKDDADIRSVEQIAIKAVESILLTQLYPRNQVQFVMQELQCDGSALAGIINASMCVLLESGLALRGLVSAVSIAIDMNQKMHLDPDNYTLQQAECCVTIMFSRQSDETTLIGIHHDRAVPMQLLPDLLRLARPAADQIFAFYGDSIHKRFVGQPETKSDHEE